jgi:hypothetical protein
MRAYSDSGTSGRRYPSRQPDHPTKRRRFDDGGSHCNGAGTRGGPRQREGGQLERAKPRTDEEARRTPIWDKWRLIPKPAPWQCVALSLNIDPDKVRHDRYGGGPVESKDFKDRLDVVKANLYGVLKGNSHAMDLREFAAWVHRIGWEAPPELLAIGDQRPQDVNWNYWGALALWPLAAAGLRCRSGGIDIRRRYRECREPQ